MDREKIVKLLETANDVLGSTYFTSIKESVELGKQCSSFLGQDSLTIILEELAELQTAIICKDKIGLIEEFADTIIVKAKLFQDFKERIPFDSAFYKNNLLMMYISQTQKLITKYLRKKGEMDNEELLDFVLHINANLEIIIALVKIKTPFDHPVNCNSEVNKMLNIKARDFLKN